MKFCQLTLFQIVFMIIIKIYQQFETQTCIQKHKIVNNANFHGEVEKWNGAEMAHCITFLICRGNFPNEFWNPMAKFLKGNKHTLKTH